VTDAPGGNGEGVDKARIEKAVREILVAIGENPEREGLQRTPHRVAEMYADIFSGLHESVDHHLAVTFDVGHDEMVMVRDIPLYSVCIPSRELINTTSGAKRAALIAVGDELWAFDDDGRLVPTEVVSVGWRHTRTITTLRVNGRTVRATPEHPFMTPAGWVGAGDLQAGDKVRVFNTRKLNQRRFPVREGYALGYILGAVGSDGSVQDARRISIVVNDRDFAQRCADAFMAAFSCQANVEEIDVPSGYREQVVPMFRVRVVSSRLGALFLHWFGGTKATKEFHFPQVVLRSRDMMRGFLDGYCDGDGCEEPRRSGARLIISSNRGFLDELGSVLGTKPYWAPGRSTGQLWVPAHWAGKGVRRPRLEFVPRDVPLLPPDGQWAEIEWVRTEETTGKKPYRVYSIDCEPYSTFLVGGVQVKNCEHHLIPFTGKAHVAYIPGEDGRITGLSKLARLVDAYAKRPQVQENLTTQIADEIERTLEPRGVLVVIEAEHLCMSMRGVRKPGTSTVTSAVRGLFRESTATRFEAMRFIEGR
jgi:GTP cyclohydrolase I